MISYHFDLYPRLDPISGALVRRFTSRQGAEYRGEANGTGSGRVIVRGSTADADAIDPLGLQYIRVVRDDESTELVVGGIFLEKGDFDALTERSTKKLAFAGAGALSYLGRAVAADEPYATSIATSTDWKVAATGTPPAGWHDVGFDDSAYPNAVHVFDPGIGAGSRWVDPESRRWIWEDAGVAADGEERSFRREFDLPSIPANPTLLVAADNGCEVRINDTLVATLGADARGAQDFLPFEFGTLTTVEIDPLLLNTGLNCITIIGWNALIPAGTAPAGVYAALIDPDLPGPVEGRWEFTDRSAGWVLWRMVTEAISPNRPQQPIPGVTLTFTADLDSDGNPWTGTIGIRIQVGEGLLSIIRRLMQAGLYVFMDPDTFELSAWPASAHGRDRTGPAWAADVLRFQAPTDGTTATGNIKSDAKREIAALVVRSDLLVGSPEAYEWVHNPAADLVWEGDYQVDNAVGSDLAAIGAAQISARDDAGGFVRLRMKLGDDEANGFYMPFEHAKLDDHATLHNGTGQWDWDETEQKVSAITLKLRPGGDWDAWVDLGSQFSSIGQRAFQVQPIGGHNHPHTHWLPHRRYEDFVRPELQYPESGADPVAITTTPSNAGMGATRSGAVWQIYDSTNDSTVQMDGYVCYLSNGAGGYNEIVAYVEDALGVWLSDDNAAPGRHVMDFLLHARFEIFAIESGTGLQTIKFFIGAIPQNYANLVIDDSAGQVDSSGGTTVIKNDWEVGEYEVLWEVKHDFYQRVKVWKASEYQPEAWMVLDPNPPSSPMEDSRMGVAFGSDAFGQLRLDFIDVIHGEFGHGLAVEIGEFVGAAKWGVD